MFKYTSKAKAIQNILALATNYTNFQFFPTGETVAVATATGILTASSFLL